MTFVVTESCIKCKYTDCVEVCPVDCFHEGPNFLVIDPDECSACGICADERCQVNAIEEGDDVYEVVPEKCIGCGLCISTCSEEAIKLVRRDEKDIEAPPLNETTWFEERGRLRGIDFSKYK